MRYRTSSKLIAQRRAGTNAAKATEAKRNGVESHVSRINRLAREQMDNK